jgi:hypothetical protein
MSAESIVPRADRVRRDPHDLIRISMDLGSDTTVAFVALPGEIEYKRIDLQFFLRALTPEPDLLRDGNGAVSHRLKSRYAVNPQFNSSHEAHRRENTRYGYVELLPLDHATLNLIDYDRYLREVRKQGPLVDTSIDSNRCFFKFIDDVTTPFAFNMLLPNPKLVFQSGVGLDRQYEVRSDGTVQFIKVHPVELIKNQVCLILENFVRPHQALRSSDGRMPEWEDCAVILTVPNTYSPFHREVLAQAVGETLGCDVVTITESDAIVFYYIAAVKPDAGLTLEDLRSMHQKYLTIDVGKGTTDLTLMSVTYKEATEAEKRNRGVPVDRPFCVRHVNVQARTGRASGGAKMTFLIARFLESLVDYNVCRALQTMPGIPDDKVGVLRGFTRLPFRLTTKSPAVQVAEDSAQSCRLLEFERLCEWFKRELELTPVGVTLPDYHGKEPPFELTLYLTDILTRFISAEYRVVLTDEQIKHVSQAILEALEQPNMLRKRSATRTIMQSMNTPANGGTKTKVKPPDNVLDSDPVAPFWAELERQVRGYVRENVDQVILELANAHRAGSPGQAFDEPLDALIFMLGAPPDQPGMPKKRPYRIRTHIIVAGQASQFKPLRARLEQLVKDADLGTICEQRLLNGGEINKEITEPPKKSWLRSALDFVSGSDQGVDHSPNDHLAVALDSTQLKDGCAHGALDWFSSRPVMENPGYIHGQIVVSLQGGGSEFWVDMDRLNDTRRYELTAEQLQITDAWTVYYLPSRGHRTETLKEHPGAIMGTLMACNHIEIEIQPEGDSASQLSVYTRTEGRPNRQIKLRETVYGAEGARELQAMLWPAILLDE